MTSKRWHWTDIARLHSAVAFLVLFFAAPLVLAIAIALVLDVEVGTGRDEDPNAILSITWVLCWVSWSILVCAHLRREIGEIATVNLGLLLSAYAYVIGFFVVFPAFVDDLDIRNDPNQIPALVSIGLLVLGVLYIMWSHTRAVLSAETGGAVPWYRCLFSFFWWILGPFNLILLQMRLRAALASGVSEPGAGLATAEAALRKPDRRAPAPPDPGRWYWSRIVELHPFSAFFLGLGVWTSAIVAPFLVSFPLGFSLAFGLTYFFVFGWCCLACLRLELAFGALSQVRRTAVTISTIVAVAVFGAAPGLSGLDKGEYEPFYILAAFTAVGCGIYVLWSAARALAAVETGRLALSDRSFFYFFVWLGLPITIAFIQYRLRKALGLPKRNSPDDAAYSPPAI